MNVNVVECDILFRRKYEPAIVEVNRRLAPKRGKVFEAKREHRTQAKYWRQGRGTAEIQKMIASLRKTGQILDWFAANDLEAVGPQTGAVIVTKALPYHGAHEFGFAVDWVPLGADGQPNWNDDAAYTLYGEVMLAADLDWGGAWKGGFVDKPHVELKNWRNVLYDSGVLTIKSR